MFYYLIEPSLEIRLFELRHIDLLYNFFGDNAAHLTNELTWLAESFTPEDVQVYIQVGLTRFAKNDGFRAGIWSEGELAGCISLHNIDWSDGKGCLGYWLGASFQGRGIITKVCRAVITYAFNELNLERIEISCAADNQRSANVARRLGFQQEGVLRRSWKRRNEWVDQEVYGMLRSEWPEAKFALNAQ